MTLPKETIDKIKKDATGKSYEKVRGSFESQYGRGFRSGYETGHEEAATEWAGKAQGLLDALRLIYSETTQAIFPYLPVESMGAQKCIEIEKICREALAAYAQKEVTNG